jgi:hypothetical protein
MKESWLSHNTDKMLLFLLVILGAVLVLVINYHGGDEKLLEWAETSCSTVLGALILILTGRIARSDGQTANGLPPGMGSLAPPYPTSLPVAPAPAATPATPKEGLPNGK